MHIFERVRANISVGTASETLDLTVHPPEKKEAEKKEAQKQDVTPPSTVAEMQAPPERPESAA